MARWWPPASPTAATASRDLAQSRYSQPIATEIRDSAPFYPAEDYHQEYYGAFVLDPDGNNVEAVCHRPA